MLGSATCPDDVVKVEQESGVIFSPGFFVGLKYPNGADCQWRISAPSKNKIILLTVGLFRTEEQKDVLDIYDGKKPVQGRKIATLTGKVDPKWEYRSFGPHMLLHFKSGKKTKDLGFTLTYQADVPKCPAGVVTLKDTSGEITSPGFELGQYYNGLRCQWRIISNETNKQILLTIRTFATDYGPDKLELYDGRSGKSRFLDSIYGYRFTGAQYRSTKPVMFLRFITSGFYTKPGFNITYQVVAPECPSSVVNLTDLNGTINSPGFDEGRDYGNYLTCQWRITVPENMQILLTVVLVNTQLLDEVKVYDGGSPSEESFMRSLTWILYPPGTQLRSTGRQMFLKFTSDRENTAQGFSLTYQAVVNS